MIFQEDFEQMRSLEQDLTFLSAKTEFDESNIPFKEKNLGIQNQDGIYTNLGLLFQINVSTQLKLQFLMEKHRMFFKIEMNLPVHYSNKCTKYILISILEIKNILVFQD